MRRGWTSLSIVVSVVFAAGPFAWQILTSLRPENELLDRGLPSSLSLASYRSAFEGRPLGRVLYNSLLVAGTTTLLCLAIGSLAAFAVAKLEFRGRKALLVVALAVSMFPPIATVSPLYLLIRALGLRDEPAGLVLAYTTFALPMALWILTGFFRDLPEQLYEAARIDGCTPLQALRWVLLPLAMPGIATTAILVFIFAYNEFLYALTFTTSPDRRTIPVLVSLLASGHKEPWGEMAAVSIVAALPLVVVALVFQRQVVSGLTRGAVKE
jgi:multiple sugar transport system permease protein